MEGNQNSPPQHLSPSPHPQQQQQQQQPGFPVSPFAQQMESQLEVVTRKLGIRKEAVDRARFSPVFQLHQSSLLSYPLSYSRMWSTERLGAMRPWRSFFNPSGMKAPKCKCNSAFYYYYFPFSIDVFLSFFFFFTAFDQAKARVNRNLAYYQTNYMILFFVMTLYLLYAPPSPFTLGAAWSIDSSSSSSSSSSFRNRLTNLLLLFSTAVIGVMYYYLFLRGETSYAVFGLPITRGQAYAIFISRKKPPPFILFFIPTVNAPSPWLY